MDVLHYTDPACPFAFSAEPRRLQLRWHYGDQLTWRTVLIVLAEDAAAYEQKGLTTAKLAGGLRSLQSAHGMPIDVSERARLSGTVDACRAVVAVREHSGDPELAVALLRRLRIRTMAGDLLDERATIEGAAGDAGIGLDQLRAWTADPRTETALREDMRAARTPLPAALVLDHKLSPSEDGGRRYSAPSLELRAGERVSVLPGFQPWESYDAAVANLDPSLERRAAPSGVDELLAWAQMPLATAEVAALLGVGLDAARAKLEDAGATFEAVGEDGYWSAA